MQWIRDLLARGEGILGVGPAQYYIGSYTPILQSSFHIRLVSVAASTQKLITVGSYEY
jgi:hypothetical protein